MFPEIVQTASGQSFPRLSWSHYIELLRVKDNRARAWYEQEAASQVVPGAAGDAAQVS